MLRIDNTLLQEIGLGTLPDNEKNSLLKHIYDTLEMRVGMRLADQMTNEQLDEFESYYEAKDDAGAFKWLETNFPNYKDIVQEEFDKLKGEIAQSAPQILSASQLQASQPSAVQATQQPVPGAVSQPAQPQFSQPPQVDNSQPQAAPYPQAPPAPSPSEPDVTPDNNQPSAQPIQQPSVPQFPSEQPPAGPQ